MPKEITPEMAKLLIANERAIVRVLQSDPGNYANLEFEFNQYADPENNRPIRPLEEKVDRNYVYDHKLKDFVKRELKRKERGLPQPGNRRIKAVSGTLLPADGNMRLYNHAQINQGHRHVIYGVDAGENPDRYLYIHKEDPSIDVSQEDCLIVSCFTRDAGTNTKWHIKGQPLNAYHAGTYPEAVSFQHLRDHNREFVKNRTESNRHKDERNEVKFKAAVSALRFVGAVSAMLIDRLNALYFKMFIVEKLGLDLPVGLFSDTGMGFYYESIQATDILHGMVQGIPYAFDIHDKIQRLGASSCLLAEEYCSVFPHYAAYVQQTKILNSRMAFAQFNTYYFNNVMGKENKEEKSEACPVQVKTAVLARKIWSDIVAQTDSFNATHQPQSLENAILQRMTDKGVTGDKKKIYNDILNFLQEQTRIVLAFDAKEVIGSMPVGLHSLNLAEMRFLGLKEGREDHCVARKAIENTTFNFIPGIEQQFEKHIGARPRYAFLTLATWGNEPAILNSFYGSSFVVLRHVMKLNSVFVPYNIVNEKKQATPCSYFHFEVLLHQATDALLFGLVNAVSGQLPDARIREHSGYEMHAYFPPINLFDGNVVERIYVNPNEHKLSDTETQFIEKRGIKVCFQTPYGAYDDESQRLENAAEAGDLAQCRQLLQRYPFLMPSMDDAITCGLKMFYDLSLKLDPSLKSATWQTLLCNVPIRLMHLFLNQWNHADLIELTSTWDSALLRHRILNELDILSDVTWDLFCSWVTQFENVKAGCGMEFAAILWEYAKNHQDQERLKSLLQLGLYQQQYASMLIASLFSDPKLQAVTQFVITANYYQLTHTEAEYALLAKGGNYWFIRDRTYCENLLSQPDAGSRCYEMLSSFFQNADTRNEVDQLILLMCQKKLLKSLDMDKINKLIDISVKNKKTEMAILTLLALYPSARSIVSIGYVRLIRSKASSELIQFLADVVRPEQGYWQMDKMHLLPPYLLPGPYSLMPDLRMLVDRSSLPVLIAAVTQSTEFDPTQKGAMLTTLKEYQSTRTIAPEKQYQGLVYAALPFFAFDTFDVKQVALGLYALARVRESVVIGEMECAARIVAQVEAYSAEKKQALIVELLDHYPTTFTSPGIVPALFLGLRDFHFLQTQGRVVYGLFDYLQVYCNGFLRHLLAMPEKLSDSLVEGAIFYYLRPDVDQHDKALALLKDRPFLKNKVQVTSGNSLLHFAMMRTSLFGSEYVLAFCDSAGANQANGAGVTSLSIAIRHLPAHAPETWERIQAYCGSLTKVDTINLLLGKVAYTQEMIIEAMREIISDKNPDREVFDALCQKMNSFSTCPDSLSKCFLETMDKLTLRMWVPFLKNTALSSETFTKGLYRYIDQMPYKHSDPDIDKLLARCTSIELLNGLYGKLSSTDVLLFSKIAALDQCVIDSTYEPLIWDLLHRQLLRPGLESYPLIAIVKNLVHALKKLRSYANNCKNEVFVASAINFSRWEIVRFLKEQGFSVSDDSWKSMQEDYVEGMLKDNLKEKSALVSLLKAESLKAASIWSDVCATYCTDTSVPDSALKIGKIRLVVHQFEQDFSPVETVRALIAKDVQAIIDKILQNGAAFQRKMKAHLLQHQFKMAVALIGNCVLSVEARAELAHFENAVDSNEIKVEDDVRLERFLSGSTYMDRNLFDMITLFGRSDILRDREVAFIEKARKLVPIYLSSLFNEIDVASRRAMPHIDKLIQLIKCYYLLDLLNKPDSLTPDVTSRHACMEAIMNDIQRMKAVKSTANIIKTLGILPAPQHRSQTQNDQDEEKQSSRLGF